MKRRAAAQETPARSGVAAGTPHARGKTDSTPPVMADPRGQYPPPDDYRSPEWLRYARAIFFEGYAPPVHPEVKNFDARRLVEISKELGGDTLRFQPIGYRATYPSKVLPTCPELGSRDLINEVSQQCRRVGLHLYCYCILAGGLDARIVDDPRYAPFVHRCGCAAREDWSAEEYRKKYFGA